jgi:hypothetical protein
LEERRVLVSVAVMTMHLLALELIPKDGFRDAAVDGDEARLVVLVAVAVYHHEDLFEFWEDVERFAAQERGVVEGDIWGQERFWDAAALVHGVEAEPSRKIADEIDAIPNDLGT